MAKNLNYIRPLSMVILKENVLLMNFHGSSSLPYFGSKIIFLLFSFLVFLEINNVIVTISVYVVAISAATLS